VDARLDNLPTTSHQWMAAQLAAFPLISIDLLALSLFYGSVISEQRAAEVSQMKQGRESLRVRSCSCVC
jgi:hypothetical protein